MPKHIMIGASAALMLMSFSAQAESGVRNASSTQIRIQAFVPVLCDVRLSTDVGTVDEEGIASLGTAREFCNAPRGYRVFVQHAADLEGAAVISDGQRIPLSPTGETLISDVSHANIRMVSLAADLGEEPERFRTLSLRIEARG